MIGGSLPHNDIINVDTIGSFHHPPIEFKESSVYPIWVEITSPKWGDMIESAFVLIYMEFHGFNFDSQWLIEVEVVGKTRDEAGIMRLRGFFRFFVFTCFGKYTNRK